MVNQQFIWPILFRLWSYNITIIIVIIITVHVDQYNSCILYIIIIIHQR